MKQKQRNIEGISLSFLDVISCGFGALILLLVLTKVFEPVTLEKTAEDLAGHLLELQQTLEQIQGETRNLNRDAIRKKDLQTSEILRLTTLKKDYSELKTTLDAETNQSKISNTIESQLAQAKQNLTQEMQRLLKEYQKSNENNAVGGIPVDSEYIIFIIDTSGSMFNYAWPLVLQKVSETLQVYPQLKGIQVMNDMGNYMFSQYANAWIPDTPSRRNAILNRLQSWNVFSNSSPVEGITKAISTFYRPGRKISLYVFGDEFSGRSIQQVVEIIERINRRDEKGKRLVRIHGVGFPVQFANPARYQETGIKFAILMRELCARHDGTFVALNDFRY